MNQIKSKIPSITNLATTGALNAKINEVKNKISNITNLATTTALTGIANKIPDHSKYIATPEFNKLTAKSFAARLAQANFASKNDIADFVKTTDFDDKIKNSNKNINSNKTKHVLELSKKVEAISTKGLTKDLMNKYSILNAAKYFYSAILQNCFVYTPAEKYIKYFSSTTRIYSWKSNGISEEILNI